MRGSVPLNSRQHFGAVWVLRHGHRLPIELWCILPGNLQKPFGRPALGGLAWAESWTRCPPEVPSDIWFLWFTELLDFLPPSCHFCSESWVSFFLAWVLPTAGLPETAENHYKSLLWAARHLRVRSGHTWAKLRQSCIIPLRRACVNSLSIRTVIYANLILSVYLRLM